MDLDLFVGLLIVKNCQKRILLLAFTYSAIFLSPNLLALTSSIQVIIDKVLSVKGLQIEIPWFWTIKRTSNRSWDCQEGEIVTVFSEIQSYHFLDLRAWIRPARSQSTTFCLVVNLQIWRKSFVAIFDQSFLRCFHGKYCDVTLIYRQSKTMTTFLCPCFNKGNIFFSVSHSYFLPVVTSMNCINHQAFARVM